MPCYHPLKGWITGKNLETGKDKILITSFNVDHLEYLDDGSIHRSTDHLSEYQQDSIDINDNYFTVPCGHCIGCRLEQSRQWANRCLLEMRYHSHNYFVTLTYDDLHLPSGTGVDPSTGEVLTTHSLVKRDFQLFMKRLRKKYAILYPGAEKLRFFMAGEYGDHTFRPHYHAIIFGLRLDDLRFYKRSGEYNLYTSDFLCSCWCDSNGFDSPQPKGFVIVAPANWETAAYTARYCTSKLTGPLSSVYDSLNILPPFTLMSRRPGIGLQYLEDHLDDLQQNEYLYIPTETGSIQCRPPKYYKRKFEQIFEERVAPLGESQDAWKLRELHQFERDQIQNEMLEAQKILSDQSDLSYLDLLAAQETVLRSKVKSLERSL